MKSLVKLAVAGALLASTGTAMADIYTPSSGNGELVLFVRDVGDGTRVYARGLGIRLDDLLTEEQIVNDPTKPINTELSGGLPDTDTLTYALPSPIGPDANLTNFLSSGTGSYVWTIMAGDNQGPQNNEGTRRYVTTTQRDFSVNPSTIPNNVIGNGGLYNNLETMMLFLNGILPGEQGSGDSTPFDGAWGQTNLSYGSAVNWFGASPNNENALGDSANFYLLASSGGTLTLARIYQGLSLVLSEDGTLSSVSGGEVPQVPVPAAVWLLGSALVGFAGISRRRRAQAA